MMTKRVWFPLCRSNSIDKSSLQKETENGAPWDQECMRVESEESFEDNAKSSIGTREMKCVNEKGLPNSSVSEAILANSIISTADSIGEETKPCFKRPSLKREFTLNRSTEWNNRTNDELFYGPYAHIRKAMDYSYHSNYIKTRQWLQDSIIEKLMGELIRTRACIEYEKINSASNTPAVLTTNGSGIDIWALPKEPWLIMVAGEEGTNKGDAIQTLLKNDRLPIMGFVLVDPQEIRMLLPEYSHLEQKDIKLAMELTGKETGYIIEILTLAALEAGTNVVVYGHFWHVPWYQQYCKRLKSDFKHLRVAILHIVTNTEGEEGADSFSDLVPHIDYFCSLNVSSEERDIHILTDGVTWDSFVKRWQQSSAWVPEIANRRCSTFEIPQPKPVLRRKSVSMKNVMTKASRHHDGACSLNRFSILKSTEENHESEDMYFYGPYAHVRKTLDYTYHRNYTRERQLLQDAIITDFMSSPKIVDVEGRVCSTPTEPFIVFTAG